MKRLYFDFALISRHTKVTGIPRVSYEYFTRFLDISIAQGGEWVVHPVYIEGIGNLRDSLHNLPSRFIKYYCDYLDQIAELHPYWEISNLSKLLKKQISGRLPAEVVPRVDNAPLRRRVARYKRQLLMKIASMDPVLKRSVEDSLSGRIFDPSEIPSDTPEYEKVLLVGTEIFHQPSEGDVIFMPAYWHDMAPMAYFTLQQSGVKIVPMLHDLLPVIIPDKYEKVWTRHFHFNVHATCLLADAVVSISHATRTDLERLMKSHSYSPSEVFVQHHGFDFKRTQKKATPSKRFPIGCKYFLMVGSVEPKKNHSLVIDQFIKLVKDHPGIRLKIIGSPGWMHDKITNKIEKVIKQGLPIDYYKDVDDVELAEAYANALATVMASSHEGFGLPVIESLSLGCPVILADIPVFREIAGESGIYFSLDEPETLGEAMVKRLDANAPRRIENFIWPTWDDQATVLFNYLTSINNHHRSVYGDMTTEPSDETTQMAPE